MDRASKGLMSFMDKHEGRKEGSSASAIKKERIHQGYDKPKAAHAALAKKIEKPSHAYSKEQYTVAKDYKGRDIKVLKHNAKPAY